MTTRQEWKFTETPAAEKDIKRVGKKLPAELVALAKSYSGGRPSTSNVSFGGRQSSVDKLISLSGKDPDNVLSTLKLYKGRMPENLIPIAEDGLGNYFALRYTSDEEEPDVVFWDHEEHDPDLAVSKVAPSFARFISKLRKPQKQAEMATDSTGVTLADIAGLYTKSAQDVDVSDYVDPPAQRAPQNPYAHLIPVAGEFGKNLGSEMLKGTLATTIPGVGAYMLANATLPNPEGPEDTSIEEADKYYNATRKRKRIAKLIGILTGAGGLGAYVAGPSILKMLRGQQKS